MTFNTIGGIPKNAEILCDVDGVLVDIIHPWMREVIHDPEVFYESVIYVRKKFFNPILPSSFEDISDQELSKKMISVYEDRMNSKDGYSRPTLYAHDYFGWLMYQAFREMSKDKNEFPDFWYPFIKIDKTDRNIVSDFVSEIDNSFSHIYFNNVSFYQELARPRDNLINSLLKMLEIHQGYSLHVISSSYEGMLITESKEKWIESRIMDQAPSNVRGRIRFHLQLHESNRSKFVLNTLKINPYLYLDDSPENIRNVLEDAKQDKYPALKEILIPEEEFNTRQLTKECKRIGILKGINVAFYTNTDEVN